MFSKFKRIISLGLKLAASPFKRRFWRAAVWRKQGIILSFAAFAAESLRNGTSIFELVCYILYN